MDYFVVQLHNVDMNCRMLCNVSVILQCNVVVFHFANVVPTSLRNVGAGDVVGCMFSSCDLYLLVYSCAYTQPQDVQTTLLSATIGRSLARCDRLAETAHLRCDERAYVHSRSGTPLVNDVLS